MLGPIVRLLSACGGALPTSPASAAAGDTSGSSEGRDGLLWWRDLARCHAGDASVAVAQANQVFEDQCRLESAPPLGTVVGVFDGHAGPDVARFACDHLFPNLRGNPNAIRPSSFFLPPAK
jgi:pyruvate dehydrogenase phosphatase